MRLLVDFCDVVIELLSRCMDEKYYMAVFDLVQLLLFTLQLNTSSVAPKIYASLVPLAQAACNLVSVPRFRSADGTFADNPALQQLEIDVNTTDILSLLLLVALGCQTPGPDVATSPTATLPIEAFWRTIALDFVLMLLSPRHPPQDFLLTLALLCTSALPGSIGPITASEDPALVARVLIDRVSFFLVERPRWAVDAGPVSDGSGSPSLGRYSATIAALRTLTAFARSPFGALQMARNANLVPRLVAALSKAVDDLYDGVDLPPEFVEWSDDDGSDEEDGHAADADVQMVDAADDARGESSRAAASHGPQRTGKHRGSNEPRPPRPVQLVISQCVLLLHTLATNPATANVVNIQAKLAVAAAPRNASAWNSSSPASLLAVAGGPQRYLITLARLNFAEENLVLERGVDPGVGELANELLGLAVTPDEGADIGECFGV